MDVFLGALLFIALFVAMGSGGWASYWVTLVLVTLLVCALSPILGALLFLGGALFAASKANPNEPGVR